MSNRHELGNMIFNLEERKNLKEVKFTKSAVKEVLSYLKELYEIKNKEHEEDRRVADLEAKLAEKEKELHYKTAECEKWETDYVNCSKLEKIMSKEHQWCLDNWRASEQDKISFAVEQLEKVKETVECVLDNALKNSSLNQSYYDRLLDEIDNQIKVIKEGK